MNRCALVLAAHGSRIEPLTNRQVRSYVDQISKLGLFGEVTPAFHHGEPSFSTVLDRLTADDVIVVPLMTSEGYFSQTVLPRELAKNRRVGELSLHQTRPLGAHAMMPDLVVRRAMKLTSDWGMRPQAVSLCIVGHGTDRDLRSRETTVELAGLVESRQLFGEVLFAFLDEEPGVETVVERSSGKAIIVVPFMITDGPHATKDTPSRLGLTVADRARPPFAGQVGDRLVICDAAIGTDPAIVGIIVELAQSAVERPQRTTVGGPLRLGTRGSQLALWQARHVAERLRAAAVDVDIVEVQTSGDRMLDHPIDELPSASPFTDDLDRALIEERIDLAVHSLKDLPVEFGTPRGLPGSRDRIPPVVPMEISAVLPRGDASEALVSADHRKLTELPPGTLVGTSSPRRRAQLLALRPDLKPVAIRGPVDDRIRQVHAGSFGAVILATAGLERLGRLSDIAERFSLEQFLPAPAQGALVVQVRAGDERTRRLTEALNDEPTRQATATELALFAALEGEKGIVVAAYAAAVNDIVLRARVLTLDGTWMREVVVTGVDPLEVARMAVERLGFTGAGVACERTDGQTPVDSMGRRPHMGLVW